MTDFNPKRLDCVKVDDDDGEGFARIHVYQLEDYDTPDEQLQAFAKERFPGEHCQHSYDCCGNFYPSEGRAVRIPFSYRFIVYQSFGMNI